MTLRINSLINRILKNYIHNSNIKYFKNLNSWIFTNIRRFLKHEFSNEMYVKNLNLDSIKICIVRNEK